MANKPTKLTPLQDRFCLENIVDFNGTAAYQRASLPRKVSKETAAVNSSKLLRLAKVQERLTELIASRQKRTQTKADDAMNECIRIALADVGQAFNKDNTLKDIHEMPEDIRRAVSSIEIDEMYSGTGKARKLIGYTKKVKFWSKDKQIDTLFKHHGLFEKDNDQSRPVPIVQIVSFADIVIEKPKTDNPEETEPRDK